VETQSILIVEDNQMNVQLVRALLSPEGYELRSAFNADEALNVLTSFEPSLVLMDIQLPGTSGLELTRQLRANPKLKNLIIIALTGYGRKDVEQSCLSAGCDGYIAKPIDTSTFPATIRSFLAKKSRSVPKLQGDVRDLLRDMRNTFITETLAELTELSSVDLEKEKSRLLRALHRWAGIAGTLGLPNVTDQARRTEMLVEATETVDVAAAQEAVAELQRLVTAAAAVPAFELALPSEIVKTLSGKRIGLAGFSEPESKRIGQALDRAECFTLCIETPSDGLSAGMIERFDIIILNLVSAGLSTYENSARPKLGKPILLVGSRASASDKVFSIDTPVRDFLMTPWDTEELLVRCCKLLTPNSGNVAAVEKTGPGKVVIADDDPSIGALLTAVLRRTGASCYLARTGTDALDMVRTVVPDVVILDVNMPGIDGFEVLTQLRAENLNARIPVVLLTARHQESDVLKGFSCGASDYITKPFNPMEVTARVARYLPARNT
jgi:two-component system cell cycle response regulator DivK